MRSGRNAKVLMLGWEYPPRYAGGLGKACRGLSVALSRQGVQVYFVLPTYPEKISEPHLEVIGAKEALNLAGWSEDAIRQEQAGRAVEVFGIAANIYPYGSHPTGPMSDGIRKIFAMQTPESSKASGPTTINRSEKPAQAEEIYGKNLWSEIERYCFAVRQMSETHEVDLVHAHDWMTFPAAFEFQKVTQTPVFLHVHATEYDRSGERMNPEVFRIEKEGFRRATHIFAVSRYTAGIIERLYGIHRHKISVVYNAPDEDSKTFSSAPGGKGRAHHVVFLGRLTFQKGPDHFLKAAALVAQGDPDAQFVFCGTGDMFDSLRVLANDLGIEDRVHFVGFVEPAGVDQILQKSKVLVMPSVSEPFGLVALEAIHCGIPVIMSKQSGVREVLHRALQVDFWDHDKLADQILAALRLPALSLQLVKEGMDQVQQLSWDKSAERVTDIYRQYVSGTYADAVRGAHGH